MTGNSKLWKLQKSASLSSPISLMSKFCGFFTTLHQQIFFNFWPFPANKWWQYLWMTPRLEIVNYESYQSQQVWARQLHWCANFVAFLLLCINKFSSIFYHSPLINNNVIYGWPPRLEIANYESYRSQQVWARQFHWWANFVAWHRGAEFGAGGNRKVLGKVGTWKVSPFEGVNHPDVAPGIEINRYAEMEKSKILLTREIVISCGEQLKSYWKVGTWTVSPLEGVNYLNKDFSTGPS